MDVFVISYPQLLFVAHVFSPGHLLLYKFNWILKTTVGRSWHYVFIFV